MDGFVESVASIMALITSLNSPRRAMSIAACAAAGGVTCWLALVIFKGNPEMAYCVASRECHLQGISGGIGLFLGALFGIHLSYPYAKIQQLEGEASRLQVMIGVVGQKEATLDTAIKDASILRDAIKAWLGEHIHLRPEDGGTRHVLILNGVDLTEAHAEALRAAIAKVP